MQEIEESVRRKSKQWLDIKLLLKKEQKTKGLSEETFKRKLGYAKILLKLGMFRDPTKTVIQNVRKHYPNNNSCRTALFTMRSIYHLLGKRFPRISIPKYRTTITYKDLLTNSEVIRLMQCCGQDHELRACIVLLLFGLRRRELMGLKLGDFVQKPVGMFLTIRREITKSDAGERTLLIPEQFAIAVLAWLNAHPTNKDPEARLLTFTRSNTLNDRLTALGSIAGVRKCYPYLFRHTSVSNLSKYLTDGELMLMYGWDNDQMIKVYRHVAPHQLHQKIQEIFS